MYARMTLSSLTSLLRDRGLAATGNTAAMVRRLVRADAENSNNSNNSGSGSDRNSNGGDEAATMPKDCVRYTDLMNQPPPVFATDCESYTGR